MAKPYYNSLPSDDTGFLLWSLSNKWKKKINEALAEYEITHVQYLLLASIYHLNRQETTCTQKTIAHHANTDIMMTSKVLRTLESKKLISRSRYHLDQRAQLSYLTKKGDELIAVLLPIVREVNRLFFDSFTQNKFSLQSIFKQMLTDVAMLEQ